MESRRKYQDNNEVTSHLDLCAYCGSNILRGAMRCVSCGKILKTPEEQSAAIRSMEKSQNSIHIKKILKLMGFLIVSGIVYYRYSDRIQEFISVLLNR
ncbi:MAG: hypothetical protein AMK71_01660 [Nitrospira bacterium SG8_35_4]|nr:MAG: hypothetical protein AMK71_01660 [Nitrospira bacterium SG8_35_4]